MFSILVVEAEKVITKCIEDHLGYEGYQAVMLLNGEDAVEYALREIPGLIVLDLAQSFYDACKIIQHLREHPKTMHVPIVLLRPQSALAEKVRAYELGVDCYLNKPINNEELLAHIRCLLRRMQQMTLSPLTRLPGGMQLEHAINYKLRRGEPWSVLYLDLDNFKAFNDAYGFLAGNDMIRLLSHICQQVVYEYGNIDDFVGHVGGDDFVIITTPEREKLLCHHILKRYKDDSQSLYRREDLERGFICGVDRKGRPFQFPLVTLSVGVVNDRCCHTYTNAVDKVASLTREVGLLTAEVKRQAKLSSNHISYGLPVEQRYNHQTRDHSHLYRLYDRFHTFWESQSCSPGSSFSCSQKSLSHLRSYQFAEEDVLAEFK